MKNIRFSMCMVLAAWLCSPTMAISTSPEDAEDYRQKLTEWSHRMPSNDSLSNEILQFVYRHPEQINTVQTIGGQSVTALSIAFIADDHELMIALLKLGALPYPPPGDSVWKQAPWYIRREVHC